MFERFTEASRRALFHARSEAHQLGSPVVDSHHILLGIFDIEDAVASRLFRRFHLDPRDIRAMLGSTPLREHPMRELPFSEESKKILAYAFLEAKMLDHRVTPAHLALGITRVEGSEAWKILEACGIDYLSLREAFVSITQWGVVKLVFAVLAALAGVAVLLKLF